MRPSDDLLLQIDAIGLLPLQEQAVFYEMLDSLIIKYQTRRWDSKRTASPTAKKTTQRKTLARATR